MGLVNAVMFPAPNTPNYNKHSFPIFYVDDIPCAIVENINPQHIILYFHPNACDLGSIHPFLTYMATELHSTVIAMEYPGYGIFKGMSSEETVNDAALKVLVFLMNHGLQPKDLIIIGQSIGSSPACFITKWLCERHINPKALVLVAAFTSIGDVVAHFSHGLTLFLNDVMNNAETIKEIDCSVCFIHGVYDDIVPISHSRRMFRLCASESKVLIEIPTGHNSIWNEVTQCLYERFVPTRPHLRIPFTSKTHDWGSDVVDVRFVQRIHR